MREVGVRAQLGGIDIRQIAVFLLVVAGLSSCAANSAQKPNVTVTADLSVCRQQSCVFVAASGARISVGGQTRTATDGGVATFVVPAGDYRADVTMPALGLHNSSESFSIEGGGSEDVTIALEAPHNQ